MTGRLLAGAALELVGTRFHLHGRDPAIGLDCVGLLDAALLRIGRPARMPNGYTLRHCRAPAFAEIAAAAGFAAVDWDIRIGDVVIYRTAPAQCHLAIAIDMDRIVHAHAGLRRVVQGIAPEAWGRLAHFRLADCN